MEPDPTGPPPLEQPRLTRALDYLSTRPEAAWTLVALGIALVAVLDWATGDQVLLYMLYLGPTSLAAWCLGWRGALAACLLSTAAVLATYVSLAGGALGKIQTWRAVVAATTTGALGWAVLRLKYDRVRMVGMLEAERRLARQDHLTRVASSRAFRERLSLETERMKRHGRPLSIAYIDIDDFKKINDVHGHVAGDEVLKRIGSLLVTTVRAVDLSGRLGGDEFAVLMPETGALEALHVVRRVQEALAKPFRDGGASVGTSVGLGTFEVAPLDAEIAISHVDQLMFEAKRAGKARIETRTFR